MSRRDRRKVRSPVVAEHDLADPNLTVGEEFARIRRLRARVRAARAGGYWDAAKVRGH
jgi:hypothetical protein